MTSLAKPLYITEAQRERFSTKYVVAENGCWEWSGQIDTVGYGVYRVGSQTNGTRMNARAHRVAYVLLVGPIEDLSLHIDHLCRNTRCVNPEHLELVTCAENRARGDWEHWAPKLTHCKRGHPFDESNTRYDKKGHRICKTCATEHHRKWAEANMEHLATYARERYRAQTRKAVA